MKFQKGSKVEVMNKTELPTSWCVAEVVSGNKHTYNLRFDCYPGVEKVSREFIRPSPPPPCCFKHTNWMPTDIVEVFHNNSWKTATVCNNVSQKQGQAFFLIRPHGFTDVINVHKSNIRPRQSWQHGQWLPILNISGSYGDVNCDAKLGLHIPIPNEKMYDDDDGGLQESKTLKRASPFYSSLLEASPENSKKIKTSENCLYEKSSDQCSVGSCSDAKESFNNSKDDVGMRESNIHMLELHAYQSTLEALYAYGPLTWEKEELLTNLRINLHISNDEHLIELRNLISHAGVYIHSSSIQ